MHTAPVPLVSETELETTVKVGSKIGKHKRRMEVETDPRPLTARSVAQLCGVELKTVHNWVTEGKLQHFRTPGRHLRFHPHVVQGFLRDIGYESGEHRKTVLVCARGSRLARLRRILSGYECRAAADVWSALIVAGKQTPDAIVFDPTLFTLDQVRGAIRAVRRQLPAVSLVLVGDSTLPTLRGVAVVPWDDLSSLVALIGPK